MKLTPLFALFAIALAVPTEKEESDAGLAIAGMPDGVSGAVVGPDGSFLTSTTQACGENSCHGFGGGDLCNDRVR